MSKTPLISLNDGTSWADAVPKLRTDELGASTTDWVQEGDTKAASLKVTANGEYPAASAGKYGYDYVTVSVKGGSATGIGPDGKETVVTVDGDGNLQYETIPVSIAITTLPNNIGPYGNRAYIDFTGIIVHAYDSDGEDMGEVPFEELVFPVTIAEYDPDAPLYTEDYQADFFDEPVITTDVFRVELVGTDLDRPSQPVWDLSFETKTGYNKMAYYGYVPNPSAGNPYPNGGHYVMVYYASYTRVSQYDIEYTYDGKTVFYNDQGSVGGDHHEWTLSPYPPAREAPSDGSLYSSRRLAWTMLYGEKTGTAGGVQIPVLWARPADGAVLETSYGISVVDTSGAGHGDD